MLRAMARHHFCATVRGCATTTMPALSRLNSVAPSHPSRSRTSVRFEEVASLIAKQPEPEDVSAVLLRLERHKQTDLAWRFYEQLRKTNTPLDVALYTRFLRLVGNVGRQSLAKRALHIEADMRAAGKFASDDPRLACALIRMTAAAGDFPRAAACFAEQEALAAARGAPLRNYILVDFLAACARAGEAERARRLYEERVGAAGAARLPHALGAVVNACVRGGDLEAALRLYREGVAAGAAPSRMLLNALLVGCVLEHDMPHALALYAEAREGGVRPDAYTLKLLLDACSRSGDVAAGLALCAEAQAEGVPLDAAARGAMLRACLQVPAWACAFTWACAWACARACARACAWAWVCACA